MALFQLAPAPKEKPFLFHLWTAPRRNPAGDGSQITPGQFKGPITAAEAKAGGLRPSPFVLDIFSPGARAGQWKYRTSILTQRTNAPSDYQLRFLDAKKKRGYVVSNIDVNGGREALSYTLNVYPNGWDTPDGTGYGPQVFSDSPGHLSSTTYSFVRDGNGLLQIKEENQEMEGPPTQSHRFWKWNFDNFAWQPWPQAAPLATTFARGLLLISRV